MTLLVVVIIFIFGVGLLTADFVRSRKALDGGIARNTYGRGDRTEELEVSVEQGKREKLKVTVSEQSYSDEELKSMFQRCIVRLDKQILGANESFDHVETDLDLVTSLPGAPVEISWELDHYDVMNIYGEIRQEKLDPKGTLVTLRAVLTYTQDPKEQVLYEQAAVIFPKTLNTAEKQMEDIQNALQDADKKTQSKRELMLPRSIDGKNIDFYSAMESRGGVLMAMALLIGILLAALEKQNREKEQTARREQMKLDYPGIVMKLTLLMGAGMTVKRAWRKISSDYEREKEIWGIRFAYEEMEQTCNEMDSGITESESYERFGKRCGLQEYMKLGSLLSQNLRKGTKGVNQTLQMEAAQSFEERKARAKRLGEEAGTKLLAPMFLMLAVVLVIVIVPAFMSVQM